MTRDLELAASNDYPGPVPVVNLYGNSSPESNLSCFCSLRGQFCRKNVFKHHSDAKNLRVESWRF